MSELPDNSVERKKKLKELILKLHAGAEQETVRLELIESLSRIPYGEVVEVEQELIREGLPDSEVLKLCDAHSAVLHGHVDLAGSKKVAPGHPIDVMLKENAELKKVTLRIKEVLAEIEKDDQANLAERILALRSLYNDLFDVDKHYLRKEYLLFPFLERAGITGPPKVMWGKHDEIRELIKGSLEILQTGNLGRDELLAAAEIVLKPAVRGVEDMTVKEEEILFPMALDKLDAGDWNEIDRQSLAIGFCLYDPPKPWQAQEHVSASAGAAPKSDEPIQLPSGKFTAEELLSILNTLPVDMTFVDKDDKVKYFSQGAERIFLRNRAILNRDVRHCHPPASAHIVEKIIADFKSGRQSRAPFWIQLGGKFIHIEYFALRGQKGEYLGTLEVSQDINKYRALTGEKRILSYAGRESS